MIPLSSNARSLAVRWSSSIMAGMGIALIVMILFILFGFVDGMRRTVQGAAETGNYVLLALGAENEPSGFISYPAFDVLKSRPEFAVNDAGAPRNC